MIKLFYIFIILLVILIIKLYLDSTKGKVQNKLHKNFNNDNNDVIDFNYDTQNLESDVYFQTLLKQMRIETDNKINAAVEEGFAGFDKGAEALSNNIVAYKGARGAEALVMLFYKMECPYCQEFMPVWNRIVNNLPNDIKYEEIECNKETKKAVANNITGVPTLILLVNNERKIYMGDRSYNDIVKFMRINGVNLIERTFEQFDSTGYDSSPEPTPYTNPDCPAVTFDKQIDLEADKYMFQIFNADGQYGYATGGTKAGNVFSPFTAAYSTVDSYLSSLPDTSKMSECASTYAAQIMNFDLCDKDQLDKILKYQKKINDGSGKYQVDGTDYSSNDKVVKAIKQACAL